MGPWVELPAEWGNTRRYFHVIIITRKGNKNFGKDAVLWGYRRYWPFGWISWFASHHSSFQFRVSRPLPSPGDPQVPTRIPSQYFLFSFANGEFITVVFVFVFVLKLWCANSLPPRWYFLVLEICIVSMKRIAPNVF